MTFAFDEGMQRKWKAFVRKIEANTEEFPVVIQGMNVFLYEPYLAVMNDTLLKKQWDAKKGSWD